MNRRVIERHMFYGAKRNIFLRAIDLRNEMTKAEKVLWGELKKKAIFKARWKRQHPIDIFVVDFYCHKYKLVIEVDGEIHQDEEIREHDEGREHDIKKLGISILRFTNKEVLEDIESVKNRILQEINHLSHLMGIKA